MMKLPPKLSRTIDQVARKAIGKDWSLYASLIEHWSEIVGEDYAKNTSPVKITFPKGKSTRQQWASKHSGSGSLTIRLPQGLAMEFNFISEQIKSRVNGFFGYQAIDRIILDPHYSHLAKPQSAPVTLSEVDKKALERDIEHVENDELRKALQNLGESIAVTNRKT